VSLVERAISRPVKREEAAICKFHRVDSCSNERARQVRREDGHSLRALNRAGWESRVSKGSNRDRGPPAGLESRRANNNYIGEPYAGDAPRV